MVAESRKLESLYFLGKKFEHRPAPGALVSLILDVETLNRQGSPSHLLNSGKRFEHRPSPGVITPMLMVECPLLWLKTWITDLTLDVVEYFLPSDR